MTERALDRLLRRVMLDAARLECGGFPEERHAFSPAFERRMRKLLRRGRHPVWYRTLHAAACLLLALLLSGCAVLAVSPGAREVFFGWVREFRAPAEFPPYIFYAYSGGEGARLPEGVACRPTWVPEGYTVFDESDFPGSSHIFFEDGEGGSIFFACTEGAATSGVHASMSEGDILKEAKVHGRPADLYLGGPGSNSGIIWGSEDGTLIFVILTSAREEETLIRMAESVCLTLPRQPPHRPSWRPEAFHLEGGISTGADVSVTFTAEDGRVITSDYVKTEWAEEKRAEIREAVEGLTPRAVRVQGGGAELYEAGENSYLVWPAEDGLYWLHGPVDGETLLRIAESVGREPKTRG